jgi:hypothetical protein
MSGNHEDASWIDPDTGLASCPECQGFGYLEDGTAEGGDCATCQGNCVATVRAATAYLEGESRA